MLPEVEYSLQPVLAALASHDATERAAWAFRMLAADRVAFVCHAQLTQWSTPPAAVIAHPVVIIGASPVARSVILRTERRHRTSRKGPSPLDTL